MTTFFIQQLSGRVGEVPHAMYKDFIFARSREGLPFRVRTSYSGRAVHKRCIVLPAHATLRTLLQEALAGAK